MLSKLEYERVRRKYFGECGKEIRKNYQLYKKAKMKSTMNCYPNVAPTIYGQTVSLDCYPVATSSTTISMADLTKARRCLESADKKEEENSMTCNTERNYLNSRLYEVIYSKRHDLNVQFRMGNPETPTTYKQLIDAIKGDKYIIDAKKAAKVDATDPSENRYGNPFYGIKFNLETSPDEEGYNAATKELNKALQTAKDIVNTSDAAAGLKALQELEAWTPTGAAN